MSYPTTFQSITLSALQIKQNTETCFSTPETAPRERFSRLSFTQYFCIPGKFLKSGVSVPKIRGFRARPSIGSGYRL